MQSKVVHNVESPAVVYLTLDLSGLLMLLEQKHRDRTRKSGKVSACNQRPRRLPTGASNTHRAQRVKPPRRYRDDIRFHLHDVRQRASRSWRPDGRETHNDINTYIIISITIVQVLDLSSPRPELIEDCERRGAKVNRLGSIHNSATFERGYFVRPAVVTEIADDAPLMTEEQFCPAIPITTYRNIDDAISRANDTYFGLCASVWSVQTDRALDAARHMEAGTTTPGLWM